MKKDIKTIGDFVVEQRDLDFVVSSARHKIKRMVIPRDARISAAYDAEDIKVMTKAISDAARIQQGGKPNRAERRKNLKGLRSQVKKMTGHSAPLSVIGKGIRETAKTILGKNKKDPAAPQEGVATTSVKEATEQPEKKEESVGKDSQ